MGCQKSTLFTVSHMRRIKRQQAPSKTKLLPQTHENNKIHNGTDLKVYIFVFPSPLSSYECKICFVLSWSFRIRQDSTAGILLLRNKTRIDRRARRKSRPIDDTPIDLMK